MRAEHMLEEQLRGLLGTASLRGGSQVDHFGELVHEDEDGVGTPGSLWEARDKVERDSVPAGVRDLEGLQLTVGVLVGGLVLLALWARVHVLLDNAVHARPPELATDVLEGASEAKVTSVSCGMVSIHDRVLHGGRDNDAV
jgi:hypothetical protein